MMYVFHPLLAEPAPPPTHALLKSEDKAYAQEGVVSAVGERMGRKGMGRRRDDVVSTTGILWSCAATWALVK